MEITPTPYQTMSFADATTHTINEIASTGQKLFIGLSGGMDSEYVFRSFLQSGIDITPVIVSTPGNQYESAYAFHECKMHDKTPVVIERSATDMMRTYYQDIFTKLNSPGIHSVAGLIVGRYAQDHGGVMIMAEHMIDEIDGEIAVGNNEWDFYNDVLIGGNNTVYFFMHTPEICTAMVREIDEIDAQEFKHRIYSIPFRPKLHYHYGEGYEKVLTAILKSNLRRPNSKHSFGSKVDFLGLWT
jgi:hypothetical protein